MVKSFVNAVGGTIGAYYENSLDQVNQPGKGPGGSDGYYIPSADGSMDCATLKTNFDKLEAQILYWYGILQSGDNNSRELENLNKIINVQDSKKDYYATIMLRNCTTTPTTTAPPDPVPGTDYPGEVEQKEPTDSSNGIMTWITANPILAAALAAGLIIVITQMSKKKQYKKRRKAA
jgi:hypothetical protein